jgi:hypothetical protein
MSTTTVAPTPAETVSETVPETVPEPVIAGHPRGRGFGILSRLARTDDGAGKHMREGTDDEHTTVVAFDRKHHTPRHRRDDARAVLSFG